MSSTEVLVTEVAEQVADMDELFTAAPPVRQTVKLPDAGKTILIERLTPKEYGEVQHAASSVVGEQVAFDNRLWNARLIARALRKPGGQKPWKDDAGWRVMALQIAERWTIRDERVAAEAVADLSGISKKAKEAMETALGNDSGETENAG